MLNEIFQIIFYSTVYTRINFSVFCPLGAAYSMHYAARKVSYNHHKSSRKNLADFLFSSSALLREKSLGEIS